jgi:hypothetical protein
MKQKTKPPWREINGTRLVVAAFGILCGLTGIIAGFFETLQGNIAPSGFKISTIGPSYTMADDFTYFAVTIIPNLRITGIAAILVSSLVIIWSTSYMDRKNSAITLLGLSIAQMLVGGGWVIDLAIITSLLATQINKPHEWWRKRLPENPRRWLARLFPVSVLVYALISISMLTLTILGVNSETLVKLLEPLAAAMFIPILLMILGGIAHDINTRNVA